MAFKADCGASTVLEALGVASTAGYPVPGKCQTLLRTARTVIWRSHGCVPPKSLRLENPDSPRRHCP